MQRLQPTHPLGACPQLRRVPFLSPQNQAWVASYLAYLRARQYAVATQDHVLRALKCFAVLMPARPGHPVSGPDADHARRY